MTSRQFAPLRPGHDHPIPITVFVSGSFQVFPSGTLYVHDYGGDGPRSWPSTGSAAPISTGCPRLPV